MKQMTITIASVPDRDTLVAELWCENELWGELSQQQGELKLEIYPAPNGQTWNLKYEELIDIIQEAKKKLGQDKVSPPFNTKTTSSVYVAPYTNQVAQ